MKVLFADDSVLILDRLGELLCKYKQVEIVGALKNGNDTLEALLKLNPDLAIVDLNMPRLNGHGRLGDRWFASHWINRRCCGWQGESWSTFGSEDRNNFAVVGFFVAVIHSDGSAEAGDNQKRIECEDESLRPGAVTFAHWFSSQTRMTRQGVILGLRVDAGRLIARF